jgi:hypothetical protein
VISIAGNLSEDISFLLGILGAIPITLAAAQGISRFRSVQSVLRFDSRSRVDIVITTSTTSRSSHGRAATTRSLTAEGELVGIASATTTLAQCYRRKEVRIHVSRKVGSELDEDLIIMGGPVANLYASQFLELISEQTRIPIEFNAPDAFVRVGEFARNDYNIQLDHGMPQRDIGLLIKSRNPFNPEKNAVLCAGLTTYGTGAVAQFFFRTILGGCDPAARRLRRQFRQQTVIALFDCRLGDGRLLTAELLHLARR